MANRRMFSKQITTSDAFLEMPVSSQLLYFHLNMEADDDGFVANPKRTMRMVSANDDDLKVLVTKRFLIIFESGVVVIKHWLLHNMIRRDMYKETQYLDEKKTLEIKDNSVYTEIRNEPVTDPLHRLGKVRLGKDSIDKDNVPTPPENTSVAKLEYSSEFEKFWVACPMQKGKMKASVAYEKIDPKLYPKIIEAMKTQAASGIWTEDKYTPMPVTWLNQMRWEDKPLVTNIDPIEAYARELVKLYPPDKDTTAEFKFSAKYGMSNLLKYKTYFNI